MNQSDRQPGNGGRMIGLASVPMGALLDLVFPPACRLCNASTGKNSDFCRLCETALTASEALMNAACPCCGRPGVARASTSVVSEPFAENELWPLGDEPADPGDAGARQGCPRCRGNGFAVDRVIPLWAYLGRVQDAVVAAKYVSRTPLGDALGRRLATRVAGTLAADRPDLVTFIPSHLTRRVSRGGNGTRIIATAVATRLERPCREVLRTTRRIAKQAWLDQERRQKNVRGAFAAKKSYALSRPPELTDRHILVVDDVLTSGATANEVARVLKSAGAAKVSLAVVARAVD